MSFFSDIKAVLTPKEIVFKGRKKEQEGIYSFAFETVKPLEWRAGKHAMFFVTHKKIKKALRLFSISSSPSENIITITTKIGDNPSEYKKALLELSPGMKMTLRGPMGPFVLKQDSTYCFIAGGIGITPFRSIMKEIDYGKQNLNGTAKLLYIDSSESFLFGEELKAMDYEKISTEFFTDKQAMASRIKQMTTESNNTIFFIAGSKQMTSSIKQTLIELGVKKNKIKTDTFLGY